MVKAKLESHADGVWSRVYAKTPRGSAWEELLNEEFKHFRNIVAVKQRVSLYDDHLIIPVGALRDDWKRTIVPRIIELNTKRSEWIKKSKTAKPETMETEITKSETTK